MAPEPGGATGRLAELLNAAGAGAGRAAPLRGPGAFSNFVYRVDDLGGGARRRGPWVAKVYSPGCLLRTPGARLAAAEAAVAAARPPGGPDWAAELVHAGPTGCVHRWVEGRPLDDAAVASGAHTAALAGALAELHGLPAVGRDEPFQIWRWFDAMASACAGLEQPAGDLRLEALLEEAERAKAAVGALGPPAAFCHGDLKPSNVLANGDGGGVTLIDFELAGANPAAYDIAKLHRALDGSFAEGDVRRFLEAYNEAAGDEVAYEAVAALWPLTWLEAAVFFVFAACTNLNAGEAAERAALLGLARDRRAKYESACRRLGV